MEQNVNQFCLCKIASISFPTWRNTWPRRHPIVKNDEIKKIATGAMKRLRIEGADWIAGEAQVAGAAIRVVALKKAK